MNNLKLENGSRVAVIGAGPAGTFFSYFVLDFARRANLDIAVDIFEPRDFNAPGPAGCNMCGGIISESLVQNLAAEGINLPATVVQRGIASYKLHMDVGSVLIETPLHEQRIAAVHRGAGPRGLKQVRWQSFDGYLQSLAVGKGARVVRGRVDAITWDGGRPQIKAQTYDLVAVAIGVNSGALKMFEGMNLGYHAPQTTKTFIRDYYLGEATISAHLGNSMHVFLLNIPRLEFAAIIPKGDYVTACMLGDEIDAPLIQAFLESPEVKRCMPPSWQVDQLACQCSPRINLVGASQPFADRVVFIGDCGVTRLYKDGIGAAYRVAKAAATTVVFEGIARDDFARHYQTACAKIARDNTIGKMMFAVARLAQRVTVARRAILRMVADEQRKRGGRRRMSMVLWDLFTGSAPYREIFLRTLNPLFIARLVVNLAAARLPAHHESRAEDAMGTIGALGKVYRDGETIIRQGDAGDCMFVIQSGKVQVLQENEGKQVCLAIRQAGEFFGEMAVFEHEVRSATVRALGDARVLTIDRGTFLRRIHEDPSLAYRLVQTLSRRIRELSAEVVRVKTK